MPYTLITGASEGLGKAFAIKAAKAGHDLIITARSTDKLDAVKAEIVQNHSVDIVVITADLGQPNAAEKLWAEATADRTVDILINNAGLGSNGDFASTDWARDAMMMQVNMIALTDLMKRAVGHMQNNSGGKILNVASTAAFLSGPKMAIYHATKAYVLNLSEAVAEELRGTNVSVTALCPGATKTEFFKDADMEGVRLMKMGLMASAEDVVDAGWTAMKVGTRVVVPGFMNKVFAAIPRILPRAVTPKIVKQFYAKT